MRFWSSGLELLCPGRNSGGRLYNGVINGMCDKGNLPLARDD